MTLFDPKYPGRHVAARDRDSRHVTSGQIYLKQEELNSKDLKVLPKLSNLSLYFSTVSRMAELLVLQLSLLVILSPIFYEEF